MNKTTGYLFFAVTLVLLTACGQVPYSKNDPTPASTNKFTQIKQADYKSSVVFTTDVNYYEPVFNY